MAIFPVKDPLQQCPYHLAFNKQICHLRVTETKMVVAEPSKAFQMMTMCAEF
jgi:hypothetical protein